jgi:hypothetical protein
VYSTGTGVVPGATATIQGVIANDATASGADTLTTWTVSSSQPALGTIGAAATGTNLAPPSGTAPYSITYTAPATSTTFGPIALTLTGTGTGANQPENGSTFNTSVNLIGAAGYGTTLTSTSIPAGSSLANLQTQVSSSGTAGIGFTTATILAGSNLGTSPTAVTMTWRAPSAGETAGIYGHPLFSDVVNLQGGNSASPYVLSMSFGSAAVLAANPDYATVAAAAAAGQIYIGYNSGTTPGGGAGTSWSNYGSNAGPYNVETYAAFALANNITPTTNLTPFVHDWGVDPNTDTAWAIVAGGATGEFAVVPEPGTLALLAAGAVSLAIAYRRRKAAKA